jgi:hypothetical protein
MVKHYIRPSLYFNRYSTPRRRSQPDRQYRFVQNNIGYYAPLYTKTWLGKDSVSLPSIHFIGTVDLISYKPNIAFLNESYRIVRLSAGLRFFYSNGSRNVFYCSVNPFVSHEQDLFGRGPLRLSMAFIFSRTVSKNFAYRLGVARSFTFGRALPIPIIGFRFGPLDGLHFNIQLPRNISLDFPIGKSGMASVFTRSMGGLYNVVTQDSILTEVGTLARLRRYEMLHGMQFNFRTTKNFSFYISTGFTTRRSIRYTFEDPDATYGYNFEREKIPASLFFSFGLNIRFGKAKKIYNNTLMYDVMNLNALKNSGLSETGPVDTDIPADPKKYKVDTAKKIKYKDVEDLITDEY